MTLLCSVLEEIKIFGGILLARERCRFLWPGWEQCDQQIASSHETAQGIIGSSVGGRLIPSAYMSQPVVDIQLAAHAVFYPAENTAFSIFQILLCHTITFFVASLRAPLSTDKVVLERRFS